MSVFLAVDPEDRERTLGYGVQFPSGTVVIEWDRKAWPEDERLEFEHVSIYGSVQDAIQAGVIKVRWLKRANFLKQPIDMDIDDLRADGGTETVWIKGNNRSRGGPLILHVSPDCPRLNEAKNVYQKSRSVYPDDARTCMVCSGGDIHRHREGPGGLWNQLEAMEPDDLVADGGRR